MHLDAIPPASTYVLEVSTQSVVDAVDGYGTGNRTVNVASPESYLSGNTPCSWRDDSVVVPTANAHGQIFDLVGATAIGHGRSTPQEYTVEEKAFWVYDAAITAMLFQMELAGTQPGDVQVVYPHSSTSTDSTKVGIAAIDRKGNPTNTERKSFRPIVGPKAELNGTAIRLVRDVLKIHPIGALTLSCGGLFLRL
jgi:hypothetical protein